MTYDHWKTSDPSLATIGDAEQLQASRSIECDRCEDGKELRFRPCDDDPYFYDFTGRPCQACNGTGYVTVDADEEDV